MIVIMLDQIFPDVEGGRTFTVEAGGSIFRQGAPADAIYRVRRGRVALVRHLADGARATVMTAGPNETFAEAAMFAELYHCDAIAQSDCEIDRLPTKQVRALAARDPERALALAAFFAAQVRQLRHRIELLRIKRADGRLLAWISQEATGTPPRLELAAPWTLVASEIGLTPEAIYRALRKLERRGAIVKADGALEVRVVAG